MCTSSNMSKSHIYWGWSHHWDTSWQADIQPLGGSVAALLRLLNFSDLIHIDQRLLGLSAVLSTMQPLLRFGTHRRTQCNFCWVLMLHWPLCKVSLYEARLFARNLIEPSKKKPCSEDFPVSVSWLHNI